MTEVCELRLEDHERHGRALQAPTNSKTHSYCTITPRFMLLPHFAYNCMQQLLHGKALLISKHTCASYRLSRPRRAHPGYLAAAGTTAAI